jgi:hypothetical protein
MAYTAGTISGFNLLYVGEAREGVADSGAGWRIKKFTYDANDNMTQADYPQAGGLESSEFEFIWDSRASYTYGV